MARLMPVACGSHFVMIQNGLEWWNLGRFPTTCHHLLLAIGKK